MNRCSLPPTNPGHSVIRPQALRFPGAMALTSLMCWVPSIISPLSTPPTVAFNGTF